MNICSNKRVYPQWFIDELLNEDDKIKAKNGTLVSTSKVKFRRNKSVYIKDILEGKDNYLFYDKEGCMNNNYPSWKHYKDNGEHIKDSYFYNGKQIVYTCGYTKVNFGD